MFNPFDLHVLNQVLENIAASLQRIRRKIWIVYCNAVHRTVIETMLHPTKTWNFIFRDSHFVIFEIDRPVKAIAAVNDENDLK
jgi:hypothetical protein